MVAERLPFNYIIILYFSKKMNLSRCPSEIAVEISTFEFIYYFFKEHPSGDSLASLASLAASPGTTARGLASNPFSHIAEVFPKLAAAA